MQRCHIVVCFAQELTLKLFTRYEHISTLKFYKGASLIYVIKKFLEGTSYPNMARREEI